MVYFLELSNGIGWIIACSLGFSTLLALSFVLYELKNAQQLPDDMDPGKFGMFPIPPRWDQPPASSPVSGTPATSFRVPSESC